MAHNKTIKDILDKVKRNKRWPDTRIIQKAYNYALVKHGEQQRKSGEPYIIHPSNVAYTIAEIGLDEQTICAALLHDVVEDTDATYEDVEREFGKEIAEMVDGIINELSGGFAKKADFNPVRPEPVRFRHLSTEERAKLIEKNKAYGRIVCRCETITEGEILDAIHAPAGARDVDGVKRRTRAGMGRCQGGFCGSKVVEILARELNVPMNEITKFGGKSKIMYDRTK